MAKKKIVAAAPIAAEATRSPLMRLRYVDVAQNADDKDAPDCTELMRRMREAVRLITIQGEPYYIPVPSAQDALVVDADGSASSDAWASPIHLLDIVAPGFSPYTYVNAEDAAAVSKYKMMAFGVDDTGALAASIAAATKKKAPKKATKKAAAAAAATAAEAGPAEAGPSNAVFMPDKLTAEMFRYGPCRLLTIDDPCAPETPPGFIGQLKAPQRTVLARMLDLEARPYAIMYAPDYSDPAGSERGTLVTHIARLSPPFSFGKTVVCIALIAAARFPATIMAENVQYMCSGLDSAERVRLEQLPMVATAPIPEASIEYGDILPFTLVVSIPNIIDQWVDAVRKFSTLTFMVIENAKTLMYFAELYGQYRAAVDSGAKKIPVLPDVILLKAGRVVKTYDHAKWLYTQFPDEAPPEMFKGTQSMMLAFAATIEGAAVARLIVDDFDTIEYSRDDIVIPAAFVWLVSATRRVNGTAARTVHTDARTPDDFVDLLKRPCVGSYVDCDSIHRIFNVNIDPEFVAGHISTTRYTHRCVRVEGGQAAQLMAILGVGADVLEMMHGDAVGGAARALGIEAENESDLLVRVIGNAVGDVVRARRTMARIGVIMAELANTSPARLAFATKVAKKSEAPAGQYPTIANVTDVIDSNEGGDQCRPLTTEEFGVVLRSGDDALFARALVFIPHAPGVVVEGVKLPVDAAVQPVALSSATVERSGDNAVEYRNPADTNAAFAQLLVANRTQAERDIANLTRLRENIREGCCQCCQIDFERKGDASASGDSAAYIFSCCQVVCCEVCTIRDFIKSKHAMASGQQVRFHYVNKCPNCRSAINKPETQLIRVGAELDLESAFGDSALDKLTSTGADAIAADADASASASASAATPKAPMSKKARALVSYLQTDKIECIRVEEAPAIYGLLYGEHDVPQPPGLPKKVLVFSMHPESHKAISAALTESGIPYSVLSGTRSQKSAAVAAFRDSTAPAYVLLVSTPKDCGGLHLPFATAVVMYHYVRDHNVASQIVARGQRLGRQHNLDVLTFAYENE